MKWNVAILAAVALASAGCSDVEGPADEVNPPALACAWDGMHTLYLENLSLTPDLPPAGATPGNGFAEAFLTNDLDEWVLPNVSDSFVIEGNVNLKFWAQGNNMPAPIVISGGPTEGYHFFNQFGSSRGFVESYAIENEAILGDQMVRHYVETYAMPTGGLTVEAGDDIRLLLTNLVADDVSGDGPSILWGGETPSALSFAARCIEQADWITVDEAYAGISILAHQGLLTGAIPPAAGVNYVDTAFSLREDTDRLTIRLSEEAPLSPIKNDVDITVLDTTGAQVWSIGSPYSDEVGTLHRANLDAMMPPGDYVVRVNSYSGHAYEGRLSIVQDMA